MKIDRLIGILSVLLQEEKTTAPELAERFEVSKRTINRDIEDLCKAGIPIRTSQGTGGGISIMNGYRMDRTILTSKDMQMILAGLRSLDSVSGSSYYGQLITLVLSGGIDLMISRIMEKMIDFSDGNIHDIDHLIRVWTYSKMIGELEGLDAQTQFVLEVAAITHDIACPLCREKYGNTNGKLQEQEGEVMVKDFLADSGMSEDQIKRVAFLVGHHHTFTDIDGIDYQILVEADYIANASESGYGHQNVENFIQKVMKTESGKRILKSIFAH